MGVGLLVYGDDLTGALNVLQLQLSPLNTFIKYTHDWASDGYQ